MPTRKTSYFRPAYKTQAKFYHPDNQINFIPALKSSQIRPPTPEIKSISTTTTKTKPIFMLARKTSDFRPAYKKLYLYYPHDNQIDLIPTQKSSQLRSPTMKSS